jgi:antitoxin VapB
MAVTTRIFQTNKTQAVRLPKDVAFPAGVEEVEVLVVGEARLIAPKGRRWASYFAEGPFAETGFMADRAQPDQQERNAL